MGTPSWCPSKEYQHGGHKVMQHLLSCFAAKVISYQFCNYYLNMFSDLSCAQGIKCHTIARILQLSGVEQRKTKFINGSIYKSFLKFRGVFRLSEVNCNIPPYFGFLWWKSSKNQGLCQICALIKGFEFVLNVSANFMTIELFNGQVVSSPS